MQRFESGHCISIHCGPVGLQNSPAQQGLQLSLEDYPTREHLKLELHKEQRNWMSWVDDHKARYEIPSFVSQPMSGLTSRPLRGQV